MAEARTRSVRIRSRAAGLFAAAYVVALASFWVVGATAYLRFEHGSAKLVGLAYFPILMLPWVGHGNFGALSVRSPIWLWWFALQMVLGITALWLYPYDRTRRPRLEAGPRALSRAGWVARVRRP
jgi:hypothetical protein